MIAKMNMSNHRIKINVLQNKWLHEIEYYKDLLK
jgi:hypothetical protein